VTVAQIVVVAVAVFAASFTQAIAGFGFGLLAVPVMTLAISPQRAVVVSTLVGIFATTWQAWYLRRDAVRPLVRRMTAAAYVGMPIGLVLLLTVPDDALRLALGVSVLGAVALLATDFHLPDSRRLDMASGFLSGVLNTSLSTNGPPLVFALQARRLAPAEFRATISLVFTFSNVLAMALFLGAGKITSAGLTAAGFALPALVLGQVAGYPIRKHIHGNRFRRMVLVLLAGAGTSAMVAALR
jgi:uncharacterized membrane protein YfcA